MFWITPKAYVHRHAKLVLAPKWNYSENWSEKKYLYHVSKLMPSLVPTVRRTTFYQTVVNKKQEEILDIYRSSILTPPVWPSHCPWGELGPRPVPAWCVQPVDVQHWPLWWRSCHTCCVALSPRQPFHCYWPENSKPYFTHKNKFQCKLNNK